MAACSFPRLSGCTLSAFTNPRRAIDGINGSLLSMEQGEALRMRPRAPFSWERGSPAVPPSPVVGLCLERNGFGASGGSRDTSRSWETVLFFHLRPPRSSHSIFFRPPPHPRFSGNPACHSLIAVRRRRARRQRCLVIRARRTFPASRWVWGSFKRCRGFRRARFGRLGLPDVTGAARTMRLGLIRRCPPRHFSARSWKGCSWPSSCLRVLLDAFFYLFFGETKPFGNEPAHR